MCATPFLFHIHGSPSDYFRYTGSALEKIVRESGFREVQVEALGFGFCSLAFQLIGGALPTAVLRQSVKYICKETDKLLLRVSGKYRMFNRRIPLGYFLIAKK